MSACLGKMADEEGPSKGKREKKAFRKRKKTPCLFLRKRKRCQGTLIILETVPKRITQAQSYCTAH